MPTEGELPHDRVAGLPRETGMFAIVEPAMAFLFKRMITPMVKSDYTDLDLQRSLKGGERGSCK